MTTMERFAAANEALKKLRLDDPRRPEALEKVRELKVRLQQPWATGRKGKR